VWCGLQGEGDNGGAEGLAVVQRAANIETSDTDGGHLSLTGCVALAPAA
jgi:hypothetical protein